MSGRQTKVINEQADRYGNPRRRRPTVPDRPLVSSTPTAVHGSTWRVFRKPIGGTGYELRRPQL
jgi:hypothetical protein